MLDVSGAGVERTLSLFDGGLTTSSETGLSLSGDLVGLIDARPAAGKDTIQFGSLFPIIVDNVDPSWTYTLRVLSHIDTQVVAGDVESPSEVPEPSTLALMFIGLIYVVARVRTGPCRRR